MAKTVEQIILGARVILQDEVDPFRYTQDELLSHLNNSLYELKRLRPDAWLSWFGKELPEYTNISADLASQIPINPIFYQQIIYYVAGYAELRDDEYTVDGRAAVLLQAFVANVSTPMLGSNP